MLTQTVTVIEENEPICYTFTEEDRKELCEDITKALDLQPTNDILETFKFGCGRTTVDMQQYRYIQMAFACPLANSDRIYISYGYNRPLYTGYRIFIYHKTSDDTLTPLPGTNIVVELTDYVKFYF